MIIVFLLAIICCAGVGILILFWHRSKYKKYLILAQILILLVPLSLFLLPAIIFVADELTYCPSPFNNELELIELDKLRRFSENSGSYSHTVLIRNPPENIDSIKKAMVQYFIETNSYIDSAYPGHHLNSVDFYKYTCKTGYFIYRSEDPGGWSSNEINMYGDAYIGFILRYPCDNDSTKYKYIMDVRDEKRDTFRSECGLY